MFPFVALCWSAADPAATQSARKLKRRLLKPDAPWRQALNKPGLTVCCHEPPASGVDSVYSVTNGGGVILGMVFRPGTANCHSAAEPDELGALASGRSRPGIIATTGRQLAERYWGQYVAFLIDGERSEQQIVRDPTGGVPCYRAHLDGVDIYFLRFDDCEQILATPFTPNVHYVLGYLASPTATTRETGLNEIEQLLPGECIRYADGSRHHSFIWDAVDIASRDVIHNADEATSQVRQITQACVDAWASRFDRLGLALSGGLDSSIVLSCLSRAPNRPKIVCRNLYYPGFAITDERDYARAAAEFFGLEVAEIRLKGNCSLQHGRNVPRSMFPLAWVDDLDSQRAQAEFLRSHDVSVDFTGVGGDEIFYRGGVFPTAVDHAWDHGMRPSTLRVALDDADLTEVSIWKVLSMAWQFGIRRRPWRVDRLASLDDNALMRCEAVSDAHRDPTYLHPLFRNRAGALAPGKLEHAFLLTFGLGRDYFPPQIEWAPLALAPLRSQPLLEWSLRTPTYVLRRDGVDRALARRAFSPVLPKVIASRKSKVFGNTRLEDMIASNLPLVRELVLDGFLVREGLLDREKTERLLSGEATNIRSGVMELCNYLNVEAWARRWDWHASKRAA